MTPIAAIDEAQKAAHVMNSGSPVLLRSMARLWGFGDTDIEQLGSSGVPIWAVVTLAGVAGIVVGITLSRKFPKQLSKVW
jgi:hypothetical protein